MISVVISAIVNSLVKHIVTNSLNKMEEIEIDGAPSWYMKPIDDNLCVFSYDKNGLQSIDIAKNKAKIKMSKKINNLIDIVIYENFKNYQKPEEKNIIHSFKNDPELNLFILTNIHYSKIDYEKEIDTTFVRACIPHKTILKYEQERLKKISKEIVKYKANNAFDELENSDFNSSF